MMKVPGCPGEKNRKHSVINIGKAAGLLIPVVMVLLGILLFTGCDGGSSGTDTDGIATNNAQTDGMMDSGNTPLHTGFFIDSPVSGLDFHCPSADGLTDEEGRFMFAGGEMMQFSIGDVMLGEAMAEEVMTPMNFVDQARQSEGVTHPMVTNMGRFLQSLDADADPENGITITPAVRNEVMGRMIDFTQSIDDFENDPFVAALFDTLNALDMPHGGRIWELCPVETAWEHMIDHMSEYMPGYMDDHMGTGNTGGEAADGSDYPMGDMMTGEMGEYMDDHMGGTAADGSDYPMEGMMNGDMGEYMDDHMGTGTNDSAGRMNDPLNGGMMKGGGPMGM